MRFFTAAAFVLLSAAPALAASGDWRADARREDVRRLERLDEAWDEALSEARLRGHGRDLRALGPVVDPTVSLSRPQPTPGTYRCRTIKLGSQNGTLAYVAYGWFRCRVAVEQGLMSLTKLTGSQRPVGLIFPDNLTRQVFLGTLVLGDESIAVSYGSDRMRDMAGVVERIGPNRWRLALPAPAYESLLDVIELVPAK